MERKEKSLPTYEEMYSWEERARNLVYWEEQICQSQIEQKIKALNRREPYEQEYRPIQGRLKAETLSRLSQNVRMAEYIGHNLYDEITPVKIELFKEFLEKELDSFKLLGVTPPLRYEALIAKLSDLIA